MHVDPQHQHRHRQRRQHQREHQRLPRLAAARPPAAASEVRAIFASMRASSSWLIAAALDAASQMPRKPSAPCFSCCASGMPSTASNMPTSAVNTISATTRGLVSAPVLAEVTRHRSFRPAQARQQRHQHEQQQRGAGVVRDRHMQRQRQLDVERCPARPARAPARSAPPPAAHARRAQQAHAERQQVQRDRRPRRCGAPAGSRCAQAPSSTPPS